MHLRSILLAACLAALIAPLEGANAQSIVPAAPAEALVDGALALPDGPVVVDEGGQVDALEGYVAPEVARSIEHVDMVIESRVVSIRTRSHADRAREYDLSDVALALRSRIEMLDSRLGYHRFQDSAFMSIDMADGKVRSNRIVLGKLPGFEPRLVADPWLDINAVSVMTGTHVSIDEEGRTVLTLDKQLRPQFGLEVWVSGAPVDTFGNEARTIGPVLLLPLEPIVAALGHTLDVLDGVITVRRTQDQAEIRLELATGLVSVNGTPRGISPDMLFAERDTLLLPFSAVETLTGAHIKLAPGTNRVDVRIDERLDSTALPGSFVADEIAGTPFTPEALAFEVSDRGPLTSELTAHWGGFNGRARLETNGGLRDLSGVQPAWASVDVRSMAGWSATVGDYNATFREFSGIAQSRIRGASWRSQRPSGTIIAIAAGVPLSGTNVESANLAVAQFEGFAAGVRAISEDQTGDLGVAVNVSETGDAVTVVAGGQKQFEFDRAATGLQSAYVSADVGAFKGDETRLDIRTRASASYAVTPQVGVMANASYDGEQFLSGGAAREPKDLSGVFDHQVGARTAASGSVFWRSEEPWGTLQQVSASTRISWDLQDGDVAASSAAISTNISGRIGEAGPSLAASFTQASDRHGDERIETRSARLRALHRTEWGTITASYVNAKTTGTESLQQLVATVQADPWRKAFAGGSNLSFGPSATLNWNGNDASVRAGASLSGDAGRLLGERLSVSGRVSALSDFDVQAGGTRFYGNLQARYRVSRTLELVSVWSDDFSGARDLSVALRGVVTFNAPRRHSTPQAGRGVLTGRVFLDRNRDGVRQSDEPGIPGVRVAVRGTGLGLNANRDGNFTIQNVAQGLYAVTVNRRSLPLGYMVAEDAEPRVTIGEGRRTDVDIPIVLSGQVRGTIFMDDNANGEVDGGEQRLEGQWVRLIPVDGGETVSIQSASFGQYGFETVDPGQYRLEAMIGDQLVVQQIEVSSDNPFVVAAMAATPNTSTGSSADPFPSDLIGVP